MTLQAAKETPAQLRLEMRRVIKGSRQRIFEAWTKPELIQKWFGPENMTIPKVTNDFRVGGSYHIQFAGRSENCGPTPEPDKKPVAYGTYTEIIPNQRLSFTWRGDWGDMPDTLVTIEFNDAPGGTEVVLTHTGFASDEMKQQHSHGWSGSFDKLARYIQG